MSKPDDDVEIIHHQGSPASLILLAWSQTEIHMGEPLSREEQAEIANMVMMFYIMDGIKDAERKQRWDDFIKGIRERTGAPSNGFPLFTKQMLEKLVQRTKNAARGK